MLHRSGVPNLIAQPPLPPRPQADSGHRPRLLAAWIALLCCTGTTVAMAADQVGQYPHNSAKERNIGSAELGAVEIQAKGDRDHVEVSKQGAIPSSTPGVVVHLDRKQLAAVNQVTTSEALKYLPSTSIRERYIGDPNAILSGRDFGVNQTARGLVYVDGMLISDFLGNLYSYPPKWGVISPDSIGRIDVLYGPFSALYPGNSMGTTIAIQTRKPTRLEASVQTNYILQKYNDPYGHDLNLTGNQQTLHLGDRMGGFWYTLDAARLHNTGQPTMYAVAKPSSKAGTPVTGLATDTDPYGHTRVIAGQTSINQVDQQQFSLRGGYDINPDLSINATVAHWSNHQDSYGHTFLRDAAGNPVYGGVVSEDGSNYSVSGKNFAPQTSKESDWLYGLGLNANLAGGWQLSSVVSRYDINSNPVRAASTPPPDAEVGGPGSYTDNGGTGWQTFDIKLKSPALGMHRVTAGYHYDQYHISSDRYAVSDWLTAADPVLDKAYRGKTRTQAVYLQDVWALAGGWSLTPGIRYEKWRAFDGALGNGQSLQGYPTREETAVSPKLSLAWAVSSNSLLRLSYGAATRFPTVAELFQGVIANNAIVNNNPDLKPERAHDWDLTGQYFLESGSLRLSLFQSDIRDAIYQQTSLTTPPVYNYQNIDRIRSRGAQLAYNGSNVGIQGLDVDASVTYTHSIILEDRLNPTYEGNTTPTIPRWRAKLVMDYHWTPTLHTSLAIRHSGRQYAGLANNDINPNTYQGRSNYTVADIRAIYALTRHFQLQAGIDNLTDTHYYSYHPFASRTFFAGLKWRM